MSTRNRQLATLGLVLALLAVVLVWRSGGGAGGGDGLGSGASGGVDVSTGEIAAVDLEALELKPGEYKPGRDPFRFAPKAPPPRRRRPKPPPRRQPPPQQQAAPTPAATRPPQPPKPQPPPVDFVYLGSFGTEQRRLAVFSDSQEIYNVLEGKVFKEKFVVRAIGVESVDVGFVGFPKVAPQRLPAGG